MKARNLWLAVWILLPVFLFSGGMADGQERVEEVFSRIFKEALSDDTAYRNLEALCRRFPGRLAGTAEAAGAVEFTRRIMDNMNLDRVELQPVTVLRWERDKDLEEAFITSPVFGSRSLRICSLGTSVGTGEEGLSAEVVEVNGIADIRARSREEIRGRVVFYNQAMDPARINTFAAYGAAAGQRTEGAAEAAKLGARAVLVRSLTHALDLHPHTGVQRYRKGIPQIPAVSVSTRDAEVLSRWLKRGKVLLNLRTRCRMFPEVQSFNVIGELTGSLSPNRIITVGGHLDCWDNSPGAHDDGGGCMQSIEVLRIFQACGIRPRHTLRAVMFMDEEVAQRGGKAYARIAVEKGEIHIAALESDRGVLTPRSLGISAEGTAGYETLQQYEKYFLPYRLGITPGGGGVDIGPLKGKYPNITLMSLIPDDQRYFDYHHSPADTMETVNPREMQMGSAAMAALIYLVDRLDFPQVP